MSVQRYTSIFLLLFFMCAIPVHAQLNLELLENSPTPSPLPPGQEYILKVIPVESSEDTLSSSLSPQDQNVFDEVGVIIRKGEGSTLLTLEKTRLQFDSFHDEAVQNQSSQVKMNVNNSSGFELHMEVTQPFSSANTIVIPPTSCDPKKICTEIRAARWNMTSPTGWGYSLGDDLFRTPPTDPRTVLASAGSKSSTKKFAVRVVTEDLSDGIYSGTVRLILLPN